MDHTASLTDILSASGDAAYIWDLVTDRLEWFGATEKLFGAEVPPPAQSQDYYNRLHPDDRAALFNNEAATFDRQFRMVLPSGDSVWVQERGAAEIKAGHILRQQGVLRRIEKPTPYPAYAEKRGYDPLTGCLDRGHMLRHIAATMKTMDSTTTAYLVLGIDKMSFVNEAVGMEAGDALLRGVADRLMAMIPARATLGRVGGDMFGVLLPAPLDASMPQLAERLLQSFRDHPVVTSITPLHITVSIGGASLPSAASSATEIMIFAEQAMHDAHRKGRNLFVEYLNSPERVQENRQMLELHERIRHAFKHDGFRLAFQPVIEAATGATLFYEALVRMLTHDGVPVAAAQFVPAIEQMGLASDLDKRVLDLAVREMETSPALSLAVNVSGLTAAQADWTDYLQTVLGDKPDVAHRLIIEITETAAIMDMTETRRFVEKVRALGGRVALDDFGAGFTSIRHLRTLALSIMKIDRELLLDLMRHPEQQHLVRMLIELARGLGLKTVAEGIETPDVAAWLRNERVDMMQGYFFGKPSLNRPWATTAGVLPPAMNLQTTAILRSAVMN